MATILPTVRERIGALDLLRGIAILGILPANIAAFSEPSAVIYGAAPHLADPSDLERWVDVLRTAFVTGKFRSTLAILFGIGIWLQFSKRRSVPGAWPGGYLKRVLFLALLGLLHGFLIWYGDILWIYSGAAIVTCLLAGVQDKWLKRTVAAGAAFSFLAASVMLLIAGYMWREGIHVIPPKFVGPSIEPLTEIAAYSSGSYVQQLAMRAQTFSQSIPAIVLFLPFLLPLFVLGVLFGRAGILQAPSRHVKVRNWVLVVCLGIGLPLNLGALLIRTLPESYVATLAWEMFLGPLMAPGYVMLGAMWAEAGWLPRVQGAIRNVGRVAMSAYILQSIVCTWFFYSWGLGLFGAVDRVGQLAFVLAAWFADIAFAALWLRWFDLGPLEWAWRSLTEGKRLPIRRGTIAATFKAAEHPLGV